MEHLPCVAWYQIFKVKVDCEEERMNHQNQRHQGTERGYASLQVCPLRIATFYLVPSPDPGPERDMLFSVRVTVPPNFFGAFRGDRETQTYYNASDRRELRSPRTSEGQGGEKG